jgi:hypothetical protein
MGAGHYSSAEDEMPLHLRTAPDRTTAKRIGDARAVQLQELYDDYDRTGVKLMDLEILEQRAVRSAVTGCAGHAITTTVSEGDEVEERITILTSLSRGDRIQAAVYSVRVGGTLTNEFPVRAGSGLAQLASHVAVSVL